MAVNVTEEDYDNAISALKRYFPKGRTVYTTLNHVSQSGMTRHIDVLAPAMTKNRDGRGLSIVNVSYYVANACGYNRAKDGSLKVGGCGMDMGFSVAYDLSRTLYGDGYALEHEWV